MKISARNELGKDLSDPDVTQALAARVPPCPDGIIEIDFSRCVVDYEATSRILDAALTRLEASGAARELVVIFNINFHEHVFLKWFFLGSARLALAGKRASDSEIRDALLRELRRMKIKCRIKVMATGKPTPLATYEYE